MSTDGNGNDTADTTHDASVATEDWTAGFRTGAKQGMTCDLCRCLVREKPGDAKAHRAWHDSLALQLRR